MNHRSVSLRAQLLLWVTGIVLAGFAITVSVVTSQAASEQRRTTLLYAEQLAARQASDIRARLEEGMVVSRVLAHSLAELKAKGKADRAAANDILRGTLAGNPRLLAVWSGWEPNGFDGRDSEFANTPVHDATGRFMPY